MPYLEWRQIAVTALVLLLLFDFTPRQHTRNFLGSLTQAEPAAQTSKSE